MSVDWQKYRDQFPACSRHVYLATAASGPISNMVYRAYLRHIEMLHKTGDTQWMDAVEMITATRGLIVDYLKADSRDDIGFCPNTSHGMNVLAMMVKQKKGGVGEIIMPKDEFPASSLPWIHHGFSVNFVETDELLDHLTQDTLAVVTSAIQFGTGYRQNLKKMGEELKNKSLPFIVNATQALGVFPTYVKECHISALTGSVHKWLCAGYGLSLLYTSPDFRKGSQWPLMGWLSHEDPLAMHNDKAICKAETSAVETGIPPFAVLAGVHHSLELVQEIGIENIAERVLELTEYLREFSKAEGLSLEWITQRDDEKNFWKSVNSGILSFRHSDPEELVKALAERGVHVSARRGGLRIAVHFFNNKEDLQKLVMALRELL